MSANLSRRRVLTTVTGLATAIALPRSRAQTRTTVRYGYSAVTDFATVFLAMDQGFFAKRGLDVQAQFVPLNPTIIPAIQSGSLQMGGPTPTAYLQGVEGGLDQVVVGGGGVLSKTYTEVGLVARAGSAIRSAAECVGKKVGVPGLGALLHVTFVAWLAINKVDPKKVTFIEAPFPQHADLIRGGSVDAVVTGGPFMGRIVDSGAGYVAAYFTTFLPEGYPTIVHVAKREWAEQNAVAVKAFRDALVEAAAFMKLAANSARTHEVCGKYLKLPAPVAGRMQISPPGPIVTPRQLQWWAELMHKQGLLGQVPVVDKLILTA